MTKQVDANALNTISGFDENIETYNANAQQEIKDWMHPEDTILSDTLSTLSKPIDKAGEALVNAPQFGDTLKDTIEQVLTSLTDAANWSIDTQAIIDHYVEVTDEDLTELKDIHKLPLSIIDSQVQPFKRNYVTAVGAEGVATGVVGWAGIPADIVALLTANLRAISDYATHYGFDMSKQSEQLYAISLLSIGTSHSADERLSAIEHSFELLKDPEVMALNKVNEELASRIVRQTVTQVTTNLVKSKAAQIIPVIGAVVAGGMNATYTASICEAAYQCYRKRFLEV